MVGSGLAKGEAERLSTRDYEHHQVRINDYATRSFRDMADGDYIVARMAMASQLVPQFLWSSQQAFEKYLKYILLINRIPSLSVGHDLLKAFELAASAYLPPLLSERANAFLRHVAQYGTDRYLEGSFYLLGSPLYDLDLTVWELRRFCQFFGGGMDVPTLSQYQFFESRKTSVKASDKQPSQQFRIPGGFLETVLCNKKHPSYFGLLWNNALYGDRKSVV